MNLADLDGLTGKARRKEYMRLKQQDTETRRALARIPSPHAALLTDMKRAALVPAPGPDLDESERRKVRNKLKASRKRHA